MSDKTKPLSACDCLNWCGDDPRLEKGTAFPCKKLVEKKNEIAALTVQKNQLIARLRKYAPDGDGYNTQFAQDMQSAINVMERWPVAYFPDFEKKVVPVAPAVPMDQASPAIRLVLVRDWSGGLNIRQWDNLGGLDVGVYELYAKPADPLQSDYQTGTNS